MLLLTKNPASPSAGSDLETNEGPTSKPELKNDKSNTSEDFQKEAARGAGRVSKTADQKRRIGMRKMTVMYNTKPLAIFSDNVYSEKGNYFALSSELKNRDLFFSVLKDQKKKSTRREAP